MLSSTSAERETEKLERRHRRKKSMEKEAENRSRYHSMSLDLLGAAIAASHSAPCLTPHSKSHSCLLTKVGNVSIQSTSWRCIKSLKMKYVSVLFVIVKTNKPGGWKHILTTKNIIFVYWPTIIVSKKKLGLSINYGINWMTLGYFIRLISQTLPPPIPWWYMHMPLIVSQRHKRQGVHFSTLVLALMS